MDLDDDVLRVRPVYGDGELHRIMIVAVKDGMTVDQVIHACAQECNVPRTMIPALEAYIGNSADDEQGPRKPINGEQIDDTSVHVPASVVIKRRNAQRMRQALLIKMPAKSASKTGNVSILMFLCRETRRGLARGREDEGRRNC